MRQILLITAAVLIHIQCLAWYPVVKNFTKDTYKGGAQNWCITQGAGGNMWFANSRITEFDGTEWKLTSADNMTSIRSVMYDWEEDKLYFGATDEFGYITFDDQNRMKYVSLRDSLKTSFGEIWSIHKLDDTLWLRENNNIYSLNNKGVKQYSFSNKISVTSVIDGKLTIFVNEIGVLEYNENTGFNEMSGAEELRNKRVCSILDFDDNILFATANDGVFSLSNGLLNTYNTGFDKNLKEETIYCALSNDRHIAFGTVRNGVYIKDKHSDGYIHLNTQSGLQNNTVLSMYYTQNGNLWLGLDKGIDLIELSSPEYRVFGDGNFFGAGYASEIYDGKLWLGTNQGLYYAEYTPGRTDIKDQDIHMMRECRSQVWHLLKYDERLFCCNDAGIDIIKGKQITHIPVNGAWKLEQLRHYPDILVGSSYDKMFILRKIRGKWQIDKWIEGFEEASKAFEEDSDGYIWFSHWIKGLFRLKIDYQNGTISENLFMSKADGFPEDWGNTPMDINGRIIFHTARGFYCFDNYNGKAYTHEQLNSLFNGYPSGTSIYMTDDKDFYFSSGSAQSLCYSKDNLFIVDSLSLRHIASKRIPGFEDTRCIGKDMLLVNTEDGFSIIRTDEVKNRKERTDRNLYIKEISVTKANRDSIIFASRSDSACRKTTISLAHKDNSIRIKAKLPAFGSTTEAQYSFLLEKYDEGWSQYSSADTKEYTGLPAGKYTYKVKAKTSDSEKIYETQLGITIGTPWYLTWFAILCYLLIIAGLALLGQEVIRNYMRRKARIMQMKLDLDHKAQDLAASTMNVIRKNETLLSIDKNLAKVIEYMAEDRNKSLKILGKIRSEIKENIQHDDIWQQFEGNFDIVYNELLKRLGERFPNLTVSDKKMCAYLKMDLSSKEIAPLLNMTVRSIEMTRYRLRKKLGLRREDSLTEFLQNF